MKQNTKRLFASLFVLATLCFGPCALAQTLVLHLSNGSITDIKLTESTSIVINGSALEVDNVTYHVSYALADIQSFSYKPNALRGDLNGDSTVDVGDIMTVINIMTGGSQPIAYKTCPDDNHPHLIDLGLPSGTLWACCNVGASSPEEYGNYYAWGETSSKSKYNWGTYQYGYYNNDGDYSHLVNIGSDIASTQYDAATANWDAATANYLDAPWHMPSRAQIDELVSSCTSTWTTLNDMDGRLFTGPNGGIIFLPATGYRWDGGLYGAGSDGRYWSSTLHEGYPLNACCLDFGSGSADWSIYVSLRCIGQAVRPVR